MVRLLSCDQFESFVENQTKSSLFSSSSSSKSIIKCLKLNDHPPPPPPPPHHHHHSHFQIDQTSEMYHRMPLSIDIIGSPSSSTSIAETVLRNVPTPNDSTDLIDQLKIPLETDLKPEPIVIDSLNLKESVENNTETIVPNSTIELYINNNNNNNQSSTTTSPVIQRPTSLYEPYRTNSKSNCTTPNQDIPYNLLGNQMGATTAAAAAATAAVSVTPNLNHPIFHGSAVNMVMTPPSPYSTITSIVSEVPNPATLYSLNNGSNCGGGGGGNVLINMNNAAGGASITSSSTTTTSSTTPGSTESTFTDLAPNPWFNGSIQRTGNLYSDFIGSEWTNSITGNGPYQPFSGNPYSGSISSVYHSHATSVRPPPPPPPPPPTGNPINDHFYNSYHAHAYFQPTPLFTNAMAAATATGSASSPNGPQSSSTPSSVDVQAAYQFNPITIGTEFASIRSFGCNLLNSSPDSGLTVSSEGPESPKDQFLYSHTHSHHHHHHHPLHPSHFHPSFQWKQQQYQQQQQQQQQHQQQQQQQQQQQHQYHQNQQQQQTQMLNVHLARPTSLPLINSIRNQIHSTSSTPEMDDDDDDDTKPNLDQLINGGNGQTQMQTPNGQAGGQQSQTTGGSQQQQQQQGSESNVTNGGNGGNMAMYNWMKKSTNSNLSQSSTGKTRTKDKYRVVYTETQRVELEKEFHFSRYITIKRKSELAGQLMLSERQVKIWFQNRRAKDRKQQRKRDEMFKKESKKESTIVPNGNNVIVANVGANLSGLGSAIPVASSTASVSSKSSSSSSTSSSSACCMPPNGLIESYQQQQQIQHVQQQQQHHQTPHSQTHTCLGLW